MENWMLWRAIAALSTATIWATACTSAGWATATRLLPDLRISERLTIALPIGVLLYTCATFAVGLCGGLGTVSFFALPIAFLALGARDSVKLIRGGWPHARKLLDRRPNINWLPILAICAGVIGLILVYVPILTPENIQHDARWYHIPIAQQYASSGRIEAFGEGWFLGAYPHLASFLYSWALTAPVGILGRLLLAAHMEFVLFVYVLASIPVLARAIAGRPLPLWAWTAMFLYPGFLVYDSNLSLGADHVAAIWAPAGLLLVLRLWRNPSPRLAACLGAIAAGAALTKYSAVCIVIPMLVALALVIAPRRHSGKWAFPRATAWIAVASGIGSFTALSSLHWLRNWISYGDPLYPTMRGIFPARPWNVDAAHYFQRFTENAVLRPAFDIEGIGNTLFATFAAGYEVNEFNFHGTYPTFGYLFPISVVLAFALPLRRGRGPVLLCLVGIACWYLTNHRDRYLQAMLPWMVAISFAALAIAWQRYGRIVRLSIGIVIATQVAVSLDIWVHPSHTMTERNHPLVPLMDFVKYGYGRTQKLDERFKPHAKWDFAEFVKIGEKLPKGAKVLVHWERLYVGLNAPVVIDEPEWQAGIHYGKMGSTRAIFDDFQSRGISHILTGKRGGRLFYSLASELLFWDFVTNQAILQDTSGPLSLYRMPLEPPIQRDHGKVLVLSCKRRPTSGVYELSALKYSTRPPGQPVTEVDVNNYDPRIWDSVEYAVREKGCGKRQSRSTPEGFRELWARDDVEFLGRNSPRTE